MGCKWSSWHSSNNSPRNQSSPPGDGEAGGAGGIIMKRLPRARPLPPASEHDAGAFKEDDGRGVDLFRSSGSDDGRFYPTKCF